MHYHQIVSATSTRDIQRDASPVCADVTGRGRSFRVVLRDAARKRYVQVSVWQLVGGGTRTRRSAGRSPLRKGTAPRAHTVTPPTNGGIDMRMSTCIAVSAAAGALLTGALAGTASATGKTEPTSRW